MSERSVIFGTKGTSNEVPLGYIEDDSANGIIVAYRYGLNSVDVFYFDRDNDVTLETARAFLRDNPDRDWVHYWNTNGKDIG